MDFGDHKSWQSYQESLPEQLRFDADASEAERNQAFDVLEQANSHFFQQHLASLSSETRKEIENGTHPSQSHERDEQALPIFEKFSSFLEETCAIPITDASLGHYHGDQIIFSVRFDSDKPWLEIDDEIPSFFEGFRIKRVRQSEYDEALEPKQESAGTGQKKDNMKLSVSLVLVVLFFAPFAYFEFTSVDVFDYLERTGHVLDVFIGSFLSLTATLPIALNRRIAIACSRDPARVEDTMEIARSGVFCMGLAFVVCLVFIFIE